MYLMKMDPRALVENPNHSRQTRSSPQADALLLASIKAIGIVHPPVVHQQTDGGNGFIIDAGRRRVRLAIKAGFEEIDILVNDADNDNDSTEADGAMRSFAENIVREALNPVDQWRAIERLVALGWTEEAIAIALALTARRIKQLRLFANVLPAMLDHIAKADMPNEHQLRTIAAAPIDEQKEVWKKHKPSKDFPHTQWQRVAQALTKTRMYAKDASFGDDLAQAYGIEWQPDWFLPEGQDDRFTTNVEAYLGAQHEWMANNLPKRGVIAETDDWGQAKLPPKASRVHGKPAKSDTTALYLDRDGKVQTVVYRMPEAKKPKEKVSPTDDAGAVARRRPDVSGDGIKKIGDFRTDALHDALARAPIADDTLMALLVLAFAAQNVRVDTGAGGSFRYGQRFGRHAAELFDAAGAFAFDTETLRIAARGVLIDALSCRENITKSGVVAIVAGSAIGADSFLASMGTDDFLACLSRPALEAACRETSVLPKKTVRETRAELVKHFATNRFVHPAALFSPDPTALGEWLSSNAVVEEDKETAKASDQPEAVEAHEKAAADDPAGNDVGEFREAAE